MDLRKDARFEGLTPFKNRLWLSSPIMHGDERKYMADAS